MGFATHAAALSLACVLLAGSAPQTLPDLAAREAAIEQRLARIAGHESTKATIRYPYDLVRLAKRGRRPLPGAVDHFDLDAALQQSEVLTTDLENGRDSLWQATGDHARHHQFAAAGEILPYRIYVPRRWNGRAALPLMLMLHGGGATENTNMDNDNGLLPALAERHGFIVVCPLGYRPNGGFGNTSLLFGMNGRGDGLGRDVSRQRDAALSEQETLEVLDLVMREYAPDPRRVYLAGHSMGSGGAWHLAAKYPERWAAVAPMSGPFVDDTYPLERLTSLPVLMSDGRGSAGTIAASRALYPYLKARGLHVQYVEVDASHLGMVPLVLPRVFDFFRKRP